MKQIYTMAAALCCFFLVHAGSYAQKTVTELTEKWGSNWRNDCQNIHTYNGKGQLVQTIYKYAAADSFRLFSRLQNAYTTDGEFRDFFFTVWDSENDEWEYLEYCQDLFRPGEKMPYAREIHRGEKDNECRVRGRYLYNSTGQKSSLYFENDCEGQDRGGIGYLWLYDAQGRVFEYMKYWGINKNLMSRSTYFYLADGRIGKELLTKKEAFSDDTEELLLEYSYNKEGRETEVLEKKWEAKSNTWENYRRKRNTYNADGTLAESLSQLLKKGKWVNELRKTYTYTEENESEAAQTGNVRPQLRVYPVPASDKLFIDLPQELPATYRLLNIQGMELQSGILQPAASAIDVHALAPALYLLYVRQAERSTACVL